MVPTAAGLFAATSVEVQSVVGDLPAAILAVDLVRDIAGKVVGDTALGSPAHGKNRVGENDSLGGFGGPLFDPFILFSEGVNQDGDGVVRGADVLAGNDGQAAPEKIVEF